MPCPECNNTGFYVGFNKTEPCSRGCEPMGTRRALSGRTKGVVEGQVVTDGPKCVECGDVFSYGPNADD